MSFLLISNLNLSIKTILMIFKLKRFDSVIEEDSGLILLKGELLNSVLD